MITVRHGTIDDATELNRIGNYYITHSSANFKLEPFTLEGRQKWINSFSTTGRLQLLVAEKDGRLLGFSCTYPFNERPAYNTSVAVTIYTDPDHKKEGLGTLLYTELFKRLAKEDLHRAYAGITLPNPASIALHEKFGFKQVAYYSEAGRKFEKYWNVAWLEKALP